MTTYSQSEAFAKVTSELSKMWEMWGFSARDYSPDQAEEICDAFLLNPVRNEGNRFSGDVDLLVGQVRKWIAEKAST